ncbi:MAG: prefoldin subunit alpha [Acidilobus sp.]
MSQEGQRRVITLDELVAQLDIIRAEASRLRDLLNQLVAERDLVSRAKEGIDAIVKSAPDSLVLFPLSTGYVALIEAKPQTRDKVIVHLGAEVYVKIDISEGLKLLSEEESEITRAINGVAQRLSEVERLQGQYEAVLQQAVAAAQAGQQAKGK